MFQAAEVIRRERLDHYIDQAAKVMRYGDFGATGCDLNSNLWWAVYTRQSLKEQAENDRLAEYLLTCARLARERGVVVPREYVIYDADSSEHLGRPGMMYLRGDLIAGRHINGVIIPTLGRLSMDDHHRLTFEKECQYYQVQYVYGDAPSGTDPASMFARTGVSIANYLRVMVNRNNAVGGNIGRVQAGKVPAGRASYGYKYRRDAVIDQRGRIKVLRAWWEVDELGPDGKPLWGSPAWVVVQIFIWIGIEDRTEYWVANRLNEMRIKSAEGGNWAPTRVGSIVKHKCYTGEAEYNANRRVPNPRKPLGDLTLGIKRTVIRPKVEDGRPENQRVTFDVPALVSQELWQKANNNLTERGRGRGKHGKTIQALFRSRMFCPMCGKPMSVTGDGHGQLRYYYCRQRYLPWARKPCTYSRFVPGAWDRDLWEDICAMLADDTWVERQLAAEFTQDEGVEKLIRLEQWKIGQAQGKIAKVEEGFDGGLYTVDEAKGKKAKYQSIVSKAEHEIKRLQEYAKARSLSPDDLEVLRQNLKALRDRNVTEATFEEKLDLIAMLGMKVYPSEDLKSRRIACQLSQAEFSGEREHGEFAKVMLGTAGKMKKLADRATMEILWK